MTVPGKGGRPRKWVTTADRQRAWRARQEGATEPPTIVQAISGEDQRLAAALADAHTLATALT